MANSRTVSRIRMMNVIKAVAVLMLVGARVVPPIRWINKCPAVILAVNRMANATGWITRLIVSVR